MRRGSAASLFLLLALFAKFSFAAELDRRWTLYVVPYSHLDVGFTQTQANVLAKQKNNLRIALDLVEQTTDWPEGSKFKYLIETSWPAIEFMKDPVVQQSDKDRLVNALLAGRMEIGAFYINHTNRFLDGEALLRSVSLTKEAFAVPYGVPVDTAVIDDVCDGSGVLNALTHHRVRYFVLACNVSHWALPPLFAMEAPGAFRDRLMVYLPPFMGGYNGAFDLSLVTDLPFDSSNGTAKYGNKILEFLSAMEQRGVAPLAEQAFDYRGHTIDFPYDALLVPYPSPHGPDNGEQDLTISEIARDWNARHDNPRIVVATPRDFFRHIEQNFGKRIPVLQGELGGFWGEQIFWDLLQTDPLKEAKVREFFRTATAVTGLSFHLASSDHEDVLANAFSKSLLNTDHNPAPVPFGNTKYTEEDVLEWKRVRSNWTEEVASSAAESHGQSLGRLSDLVPDTGGPPAKLVFNPLPWRRREVTLIPKASDGPITLPLREIVVAEFPPAGYKIIPIESSIAADNLPPPCEVERGEAEVVLRSETHLVRVGIDPFGVLEVVDRVSGRATLAAAEGTPFGRNGTVSRSEVGLFGGGTLSGLGKVPSVRYPSNHVEDVETTATEASCGVRAETRTDGGVAVRRTIRYLPALSRIEFTASFDGTSPQSVEHVFSYHLPGEGPSNLRVESPYGVLDYGGSDPLKWFSSQSLGDLFFALELVKPMQTINATNDIFSWIRGLPPSLVIRNFLELTVGGHRLVFSSKDSGAILPYPYRSDSFSPEPISGFEHVCLGPTAWGDIGLGAYLGEPFECRSAIQVPGDSKTSAARFGWEFNYPLLGSLGTDSITESAGPEVEGNHTVGFVAGVNTLRLFQAGPSEKVSVTVPGQSADGSLARMTADGEPICRLDRDREGRNLLRMEENELATIALDTGEIGDLPECPLESDGGGCECETIGRGRRGSRWPFLPHLFLAAYLLIRRVQIVGPIDVRVRKPTWPLRIWPFS